MRPPAIMLSIFEEDHELIELERLASLPSTPVTINVLDVTEELWYRRDMSKVYEAVKEQLAQHKKVILSFKGLDDLYPGQLGTSVGLLYEDFSPEHIELFLTIVDYPAGCEYMIDRVYKMGRLYWYNQTEYCRLAQRAHEIARGYY